MKLKEDEEKVWKGSKNKKWVMMDSLLVLSPDDPFQSFHLNPIDLIHPSPP